jgi:hypothetical protein
LGFIYRPVGVGNHRCVLISAPFSFVTFLLGERLCKNPKQNGEITV